MFHGILLLTPLAISVGTFWNPADKVAAAVLSKFSPSSWSYAAPDGYSEWV